MNQPTLSADWSGRSAESLLWLASYPRSGNTFTRILLANYFALEGSGFDLNKLRDFIPSDTAVSQWDRAFPGSGHAESWEQVWKARPAILSQYRMEQGTRALPGLKTHSANVVTFGTRGFDFRPDDRAIYVVRHPLDVLVSLADFNAKDIDTSIDQMTTSGFALKMDDSRMEVRGSWAEHVSSWVLTPPCPLLLVRYEELCLAPADALRSILDFLGVPVIEERLSRALAHSRFDRLREQEETRNFIERPDHTRSGKFFREGKTLQWLRQLTPQQAYRLADACEEMMARLGYTHPRQVLFDGRNALGQVKLSA